MAMRYRIDAHCFKKQLRIQTMQCHFCKDPIRFQSTATQAKSFLMTLKNSSKRALPANQLELNEHSIDYLARVNGYHPISMTYHNVPLAEGVLAEASKTLQNDYRIFGKPSKREPIEQQTLARGLVKFQTRHPSFREEDFSLFRILQTSVEESINQREESIRMQLLNTKEIIQQYLSKLVQRAYMPAAKVVDSNVEPEQQTMTSSQRLSEQEYPPGNEDILIVYDQGQRVLLVQDVPPRYRLLALPNTHIASAYHLHHGRAASVIYTGLVLVGVAPLAYRSLKYALDYPGLTQLMVASVVGSVSYSLWASRFGARTRQLLVVTCAALSRVVARDESAMLVLRDGAIQTYSNIVDDKDEVGVELSKAENETS